MINYDSHTFKEGEEIPAGINSLEKPQKSCSVLFVSQYTEQPLNKEFQKVMNHLGYKVFVIKKKAGFLDTFLSRASSCKFDSNHKLSSRDDGHCDWCQNQSQKSGLEDTGYQTCATPCHKDYCNFCLNQQNSMLGANSNTFIITGANWAEDIVNQT